jgi:dynein heavy chain 1, cytosolic
MPTNTDTAQEVRFWAELEVELQSIEKQTKSQEADCTLTVLRQARRFFATAPFDSDTLGLGQLMATVGNYKQLTKEFPLNELLTASDVRKLIAAVKNIFEHLKKSKASNYPVPRYLRLLEAVSRDMLAKLVELLRTSRFMSLPYSEFERLTSECHELFQNWEEQFSRLREVLRELGRRRRAGDEDIPLIINVENKHYQERIGALRKFRHQHDEFRNVISRVLSQSAQSFDALGEMDKAYELIRVVDPLQLSPDGLEAWRRAVKEYEDRIERVETHIKEQLRERLAQAKSASEMFRVFSKFNALFFRPRIRGAISEYQAQLIVRVKEDIQQLHERFKSKYSGSQAALVSENRDIPPVSGAIMWARQIERQLKAYMRRVEDVLGKRWEMDPEGRKLKDDFDLFRQKLNTDVIFEKWVQETLLRKFEVSGRVLDIVRKGNQLQLDVNFDQAIVTLFKEVRNLQWLGYTAPFQISLLSSSGKQIYPAAVSLKEVVRLFSQASARVTPEVALLVARYKRDAQLLVTEGIRLRWEALPKLDPFVSKFSVAVNTLQEKVDDVTAKFQTIRLSMEALKTCSFTFEAFRSHIQAIQGVVDQLNLAQHSNLDEWTQNLDKQVEQVLLDRLSRGITSWVGTFEVKGQMAAASTAAATSDRTPRKNQTKERLQIRKKTSAAAVAAIKASVADVDEASKPDLTTTQHEIVIRNQVMQLDPPLENARVSLLNQFNAWLGSVTGLPRLQASRYDDSLSTLAKVYEADVFQTPSTFRDLIAKLPLGSVDEAFQVVEKKLKQVSDYVKIWLQYQALWDIEPAAVYERMGDNLDNWRELLLEIRRSRTTFDSSDSQRDFGPVVIRYSSVQTNVNNKYDYWHKDILHQYGTRVGEAMKKFHSNLVSIRVDIEALSIETSSTPEAVNAILKIQDVRKNLTRWEQDVDRFGSGQQILQRQRFAFPADWLDFEVVDGEWQVFTELLARKTAEINAEVPVLQRKVLAEGKSIEERISTLQTDWNKEKPIGAAKFSSAIEQLSIFAGRVSRLEEEVDRIRKARQALDLDDAREDEKLKPIAGEISDLRTVWNELASIWKEIDEMKEVAWTAVIPRKIRKQLEDLVAKLKSLPNKIRQYQAFLHVQELLKQFLDNNGIVTDLRSEALKERHWKLLRKKLGVSWVLTELTLGDVWDSDLQKNKSSYNEIISQAQGELALEEFLKEVKEIWQTFELDLVVYQRKTSLIRGWDELFGKIAEHVNSISAMKNSPYFKVFEADALQWEEKLNKSHALFDIWIDVQRRWVYLEGIFSGSSDIRNLLPRESARFDTINSEFLNLMTRVSKTRVVMEIVAFEGIDKLLERLSDLLTKIQKALGEYLERQRSAFPRFYFIGDEDLLDVIGNSKDLLKVQKHLKKMFAGLSQLLLDSTGNIIEGMSSPEGEVVPFKKHVNVKDYQTIDGWLKALEAEMRMTLALSLSDAMAELESSLGDDNAFLKWIDTYPTQLVIVGAQVQWSTATDKSLGLSSGAVKDLELQLSTTEKNLRLLADKILGDLPSIRRKKYEHLITEFVHQRDVLRRLIRNGINSPTSFEWLCEMRFYFNSKDENPLKRVAIKVANGVFDYGFEYLGVADRLVQTPLTDRCYLTLTQALSSRMGGSPYGPAGTGKTETVKALGQQLGRLVFVFCCDEAFDFQAMSRIFVGLCMCGAWGCFDEFNRLEERILSAVSQQIQTIQVALKDRQTEVDLTGKRVLLNEEMAIFVTMNPGYAGRSNLPDNLKQLFRGIAMIKPDRELIAQVMLYSQGFKTAERLSTKIVPLFELCDEQLSRQAHYDFGLRALKSVLVSAGNLKRHLLADTISGPKLRDLAGEEESLWEQSVQIQSVCENVIPKLVAEDIPLFRSLLSDVFPGADPYTMGMDHLRSEIIRICGERFLVASPEFVEKLLQLYQVQVLRHGVMLVGPSGSGKSCAWSVLLEALEITTKVKSESYVLDPKAITKEQLFGSLESTTREWTDGLFTAVLRKIIDNLRGESEKRHWIVFDGDVDPEWVENLNALLDDNKLLTLPNGERLALPENVRIIFEVQDLKSATLATVSRCGMIWFNEETVTNSMIFENYLTSLRTVPLDDAERSTFNPESSPEPAGLALQRQCADLLAPHFSASTLVESCLLNAAKRWHIMDFTRLRVFTSMASLLNKAILNVIDYNNKHSSFLGPDAVERYILHRLLFAIMWGFGGSMSLAEREDFSKFVASVSTLPGLPSSAPLLDYFPLLEDNGDWRMWRDRVPRLEIETHQAASPDLVIPTVDTIRHVEVVKAWLSEHKPLLLCGPPGSGKTMTLEDTLRQLPDYELVSLNFSSATSPELLMKTFEHHCEYKKTPKGTMLRPTQQGKWLVVFCDEINLPQEDKYGTQRVITFLRQLIEKGGFWRTSDHTWITLDKIQFLGACNPPTDPGRVPLSHRFLRHAPLLYVDFPSPSSLKQIYGTFNRALLKLVPDLRSLDEPLTDAMVEFYTESQKRFTPDQQAHYIYSPRELTRWVRALREALVQWEGAASLDDFVRLFVHEGLRLFQDRLVSADEKAWTDDAIDSVATKYFPRVDSSVALQRPVLFSNWLSKDYRSVSRQDLRDHVRARLKVFYEEELDVPLVLFNEVLDHILRIDRVFRQPQGHALLIGVSGGGKTVLSRFVAWMNGLSIFTIKVNNRYSPADFDDDLRHVMKRAGVSEEKICFIFDESNVLSSAFLERMNTLLASGEVPGLFEGDEYASLMHQLRETVARKSLIMDSESELFRWFTQQVRRNLHVVFTMNPSSPDFHNRAATSPALFNRCVLDWFGEWSDEALFQVGEEFTRQVDLDSTSHKSPDFVPTWIQNMSLIQMPLQHRDAVISSLVYAHRTIDEANAQLVKQQGRQNYVTPRHYLDFIKQFVTLVNQKRGELEEQQLHLNVGLSKLHDTEKQVKDLQAQLTKKNSELEEKSAAANAKLSIMVEDERKALQKKEEVMRIQSQVESQQQLIREQQELANKDLARAEPALLEAKSAVEGIKKKQLDEIRALPSPPLLVKLTLEATLLLLTGKKSDWTGVRKALVDAGFIQTLMTFDSKNISAPVRKQLQEEYFSQEKFNFDNVNRASVACGPLVKWMTAQMDYSEMLDKVDPLRRKVAQLEIDGKDTQVKYEQVKAELTETETTINRLKEEYAGLISQAQQIKTEMSIVQAKVDRSISLLRNLSSESVRWESESKRFDQLMSTVVGDSLLAAAFLAYSGFFDQFYRASLMTKWREQLEAVDVRSEQALSVTDYLSHPDDRLKWHAKSLPVDDLAVENAIMLHRFNRYPLVIDPSGQATEFLMKYYEDKKITKTSFLDSAFMKNLESALRFGTPLLVEDVESIDPVLNPVLNKEIRKAGGRVLIRLGDNDIDFSPSFVIFLATRDPTAHFTPDLCSRVTFVNFTVTPKSLQAQCLHAVLKAEQPSVSKKRMDVMEDQGKNRVKLRNLERALLNALSESQGNILDDDKVMTTLETIKRDAADINQQVEQTDKIMEEIRIVSESYRSIALASSHIYFTLEQLSQVHFLYQFSLNFFLDIFYVVLNNNTNLEGVKGERERLDILIRDLFSLIYKRVSRSLLHDHRLAFALRLAQIYTKGSPAEFSDSHFDFLLTGGSRVVSGLQPDPKLDTLLSATQRRLLLELQELPGFRNISNHVSSNFESWQAFLQSSSAEEVIPKDSFTLAEVARSGADPAITSHFMELLLLKVFRIDRLLAGSVRLINSVFGSSFLRQEEFDFSDVVKSESRSASPLLLCAAPGFDPSARVDDLAANVGPKSYKPIAIGSAEGFDMAEKSINALSKSGGWVHLKNVHLAPQWLSQLEKKLHSLKSHPDFRLFLTSEIHPKLPSNLLRLSHIFVFEPAPGIKANLQQTLAEMPSSRTDKQPAERSRVHFLLAWFHALLIERLRYAPFGWTKTFEFNNTDRRSALDTIDYWVESVAQGRAHVDPDQIPWPAIRRLLGQTIYGGRIDNGFDQRLLDSFLDQIFSAASFNADFALVDTPRAGNSSLLIRAPEGLKRADYMSWVESLPSTDSPSWLGLPDNAELLLLQIKSSSTLQKLLKMQTLDESEAADISSGSENASAGDIDGRPPWMKSLEVSCAKWLDLLPQGLKPLDKTAGMETNPLFRFFAREYSTGITLLSRVIRDIASLRGVCRGEVKQTNYNRALINSLTRGMIPAAWSKEYSVMESTSLNEWLLDLSRRIAQLDSVRPVFSPSASASDRPIRIWLGGLFKPEAFITATRQRAARAKTWSLESLVLDLLILDTDEKEKAACIADAGTSFIVDGLRLQSASWKDNRLALSADMATALPPARLIWRRREDASMASQASQVTIPVYLNDSRKDLLVAIPVDAPSDIPVHVWFQRGCAITTSNV